MRLVLFLLVIPILSAYPFGDRKSLLKTYLQGFALLITVFAGMYIPALIICAKAADISFSSFSGAFSVAVMLLSVYGVLVLMQDVREKDSAEFTAKRQAFLAWFKKDTAVKLVCIIFILFQAIRLVFLEPYEYLDEKTYISLINDILSTDVLYGTYSDTGALYDGIGNAIPKYLLAPWYPFLAYLCHIGGVHPLILGKTILPVVMLLLSYASLYFFGRTIIGDDEKSGKLYVYMLIVAVLLELMLPDNDQSVAALVYTMWGKNLSAAIAVPMIFVTFTEKNVKKAPLWLFIFSTMGCAGSASCMAVIPLEGAMLLAAELIVRLGSKDKEKSAGILPVFVRTICILIPPLIEAGLYFYFSSGGLLA